MTTQAAIPPLVYTSQVPGSRFHRLYGAGGVSFIVEPYPLPLFSAWLTRITLRRYGPFWLIYLAAVCAVMPAAQRSHPTVGFVLGNVACVIGWTVVEYLQRWYYWRCGLTIRIDPEHVTLRTVKPFQTRDRRWQRDQITKVACYGINVKLRFANRRPFTFQVDSRDAAWLAAALRSELDIA